MKTIKFEAKEIPVIYETEVLVIGGGPGGVGAAIASARNGARTMLVEKRNSLGGLSTNGLVSRFMNRDYHMHSGLYKEITDELEAKDAILENVYGCQSFDRELMKFLLENMIKEAGVELLYNTSFSEAIVEGGAIKGVVVDSVAGKQAILANIVIDCTRVGDVARSAGADILVSRPSMRSGFLTFCVIRNVDYSQIIALQNEDKDYINDPTPHIILPYGHDGVTYWPFEFLGGQRDLKIARTKGEFTYDKHEVFLYGMMEPGPNRMEFMIWVKDDDTGYDDKLGRYDMKKLTQAELDMKEQFWAMHDHLKKNVRGFANSNIDITSSEVGYFVTRLEGDYIIGDEDAFNGREFDDCVGIGSWFMDSPEGRRGDCPPHDIPLRSLYSKNIENLMGGGYNISTQDAGAYTTWDQPTCICVGQASGTAAALAIKAGVSPRNVDIKELQKNLQSQDVTPGVRFLSDAVRKEYDDAIKDMRERMEKAPKVELGEERIF